MQKYFSVVRVNTSNQLPPKNTAADMMTKMSQVAGGCDTKCFNARGSTPDMSRRLFRPHNALRLLSSHALWRCDFTLIDGDGNIRFPAAKKQHRTGFHFADYQRVTNSPFSVVADRRKLSSQAWFTCSRIGFESLCGVFLSFFKLELFARFPVLNDGKYFHFD